MEQIIANLLVADNTVIQKATSELNESFKHPETISALCEVVVSSKEPQIRQYSAVILRKRFGKLRNWHLVPVEQQAVIKNGMLQAIINEQEKSVRTAIAQFVGVLVKHEFAKNDPWSGEVLQFIFGHCASADPAQAELGSSIFSILTDIAPDQFLAHMEAICEMFSAALVATEASGNMVTPVIFNILDGMAHLVPFILGHNGAESTYQKSIPYVVKALLGFAAQQPDKFIQAFDILENMADYTPKLLTGNLKLLIDFCLEVANKAEFDDSVRVRAVSYIGWLIRLKKKAILKQKMVEPIVQVVFNLMSTAGENDDEEDDDDEEYFVGEDSSPRTTATQTMDLLALHVPPEKLLPPLLALIEPALKGENPLAKKAAYLSMAVIAEGCGEAICSKYLKLMLDTIKVGIVDPNPTVRNAALFALGQFSEHLQPDISKYASEVLPILFEFLHQLCAQIRSGGEEPKHIDRMFYALETYCENLEDAIVPHLPLLMERLFEALSPTNSVHLRELALSAVSSTASAAKENMLPYFEQIIKGLQTYLIVTDNEDIIALRPQAIDTLAAIARTIGKENFLPLTSDTMTFALNVLAEAAEPELRSSLYNLLASLAEVVNAEMGPVLPKIVERMLETVKSSEEVQPDFKEENGVPSFGGAIDNDENDDADDIDIENSDDEDDDDIAGFSVENAFLDEKEEAIIALKQIAEHTGLAFAPYIQPCYEAIYKLLDHPQEDIRKVSIEALAQLIISLFLTNDIQSVNNALVILVPKYVEIIKSDEECPVVMTTLESIGVILKELKQNAVPNDDIKNAIFGCIQDVLLSKVACQFNEPLVGGGGVGDDEQEESEYDEALIEIAGDVLPKFGEALTPDEFALFFGRVWTLFTGKIEKTRGNEELESQRSFAFGALSECFRPLQSNTGTWFESLLPFFLEGIQDNCEQVRQNSVFGLGELVIFSDEKAYPQFPVILQALSAAVSQEKHPGTLDNICGALARLIMTNYSLIPLEQVLPVFVQHLPLREDHGENGSVFKCFQILFTQGSDALLPVLDRVIMVGLHVLYKNECNNDDTRQHVLNFLKEVRDRFPEKFNEVANSQTEIANFVQSL